MACKVSELMASRCLGLRLRGSGLRASVIQPPGFSSKSFRCCRCCGSSLRTSGFMVEGIITISLGSKYMYLPKTCTTITVTRNPLPKYRVLGPLGYVWSMISVDGRQGTV